MEGKQAKVLQRLWSDSLTDQIKETMANEFGTTMDQMTFEVDPPLTAPVTAKDGTILKAPDGFGYIYGYFDQAEEG